MDAAQPNDLHPKAHDFVLADLVAEPLKALADTLDTETATLTGDIADERLSEALVKLPLARFGKSWTSP